MEEFLLEDVGFYWSLDTYVGEEVMGCISARPRYKCPVFRGEEDAINRPFWLEQGVHAGETWEEKW